MSLDLLAHRLNHRSPSRAEGEEDTPRAAVAAIIRPGGDLLFIRRADREGDPWSGHMAFPGGRSAPTDRDVVHTATRETLEEVGLDLEAEGHLLGQLDELATPSRARRRSPLVVVPYVFRVARNPPLSPNEEVAEVYWFALDRLRSGEGRGTLVYHYDGVNLELPCVRLDGTTIWGITLRMVDELLALLNEPPPVPSHPRAAPEMP